MTIIEINASNKGIYFSPLGPQLEANTNYTLSEDITLNVNEYARLNDGVKIDGRGYSIYYVGTNDTEPNNEIHGLFVYIPVEKPSIIPDISHIHMCTRDANVHITHGAGSIIRKDSTYFTINNCSNSIQVISNTSSDNNKPGCIVGSNCNTFTIRHCFSILSAGCLDSVCLVGNGCHSYNDEYCYTTE